MYRLNLCTTFFGGVSGFLPRIAATHHENSLLRNATTRNTKTNSFGKVAREIAWINLKLAADAAPTHCIVVIVAAFNWTYSTLVMKQNAAKILRKQKREARSLHKMMKTFNNFAGAQ